MRRQKSRWEEDNEIPINWGAVLAAGLFVAALAGLALLLSLT